MIKPDLILQWCVFCDYPIFRAWVKKYRHKFNKIILYPSRQHGVVDLQNFAEDALPENWVKNHVIDWSEPGIDWRQAEVTPCLERVESDWIWFAEQDFFAKDWDKLFADIEKAAETADMIGLWNETHFPYVHPSCLIIKKEMLDKTNKDFRAHPEINGCDHFAMITKEVQDLGGKITTLQDMGYNCDMSSDADCFHLGGMTYVYQDFKGEETIIGVRNPEAFYVYNRLARETPGIPLSHAFTLLSEMVETVLNIRNIKYDPKWEKFFKI